MTFHLNLLLMLIPMKSIRKNFFLSLKIKKKTTQSLHGKMVELSTQPKWNAFSLILSLLPNVNLCVTQWLSLSVLSGGYSVPSPCSTGMRQG